ncbi:MAG TPA: RecQ family ATP-dependent DNA helicase, partial [Rhodothermales bacterium]|nr:RecQ family ATP-dependent DNA helicase [Rhodothermales bacterium]
MPHTAEPRDFLKRVFGYDTFRPRQESVIRRVIDGGNALVVMPTGGGKSLCYQLPALVRKGTGIVVSPLISLMQDQVNTLKQLGIRAEYLNSSLSASEQARVEQTFRAGELDLLYVAPERLTTPAFMAAMEETDLALLAIDEAHCISQWGHDFRPEYHQLETVRKAFPDVPCIAVTATADEPTRREILRRLNVDPDGLFVTGFDRPNIRYRVVNKNKPKQQLLDFIISEHPEDAGIVYCLSRKSVEETAAWLRENGRDAVPYHAGLSSRERQENQNRFL